LRSQLIRAADSIASNIAEGCGAQTRRELARFLDMAIKSASETENHLMTARDLGLISREDWLRHSNETIEIRKMAYAYRKKVLESDHSSLRLCVSGSILTSPRLKALCANRDVVRVSHRQPGRSAVTSDAMFPFRHPASTHQRHMNWQVERYRSRRPRRPPGSTEQHSHLRLTVDCILRDASAEARSHWGFQPRRVAWRERYSAIQAPSRFASTHLSVVL
jgi:four helix bundle protein